MTQQTISTKLRTLTPDDGMALTDGKTYTTGTVFLGSMGNVSDWTEISESEIPETPESPGTRMWTPLSIKRACGERWEDVKAALQRAGLYDDFVMAQVLREDDETFRAGYEMAVQAYGKETVDGILDLCPRE